MKRLLILGGTAEARALAGLTKDVPKLATVLSLAGRTTDPLDQNVETRIGGFGGVSGLIDYLTDSNVDLMIDATHPFARQMSAHANDAAIRVGLDFLRIDRPVWGRKPDENWIRVPDLAAAVAALPPGARPFCATGRGSLQQFTSRSDIYPLLRVIDQGQAVFPGAGEFVVGRPPFDLEAEIQTLKSLKATHLVVKNAGGTAGRTKLAAAGQLGLPIVIVDRPNLPDGVNIVPDAAAAFAWIKARMNAA